MAERQSTQNASYQALDYSRQASAGQDQKVPTKSRSRRTRKSSQENQAAQVLWCLLLKTLRITSAMQHTI